MNVAGTPSVTSGDETTVPSSGSRYLFESEHATLVYHLDVTSVKDIRLYIDAPDFAVGDLTFTILSQSPGGTEFVVDSFKYQDPTTGLNTRLYDLFGTTLSIECVNNTFSPGTVSWMLVGRSN